MTALLEKRILEQFAAKLTNASKMSPGELDQMMQRIAMVVEDSTGVKMNWELPSPSHKATQQEQAKTLAALIVGALLQ